MVLNLWRSVNRIPDWAEAVVVLLVVFGLLIAGQGSNPEEAVGAYTDREILGLLVWEIFLMGVVGVWLWARGWKREDLAVTMSWRGVWDGCKVWLLAMGAYYVTAIALMQVPGMEENADATRPVFAVSLPMIIAVSIVNPCFEEFFTVAYLWKRLPGYLFIGVSAGLRGLVHMYQGTYGMMTVFVLGLVFAIYFSKKRALLPLIVAHTITDFLGLVFSGY